MPQPRVVGEGVFGYRAGVGPVRLMHQPVATVQTRAAVVAVGSTLIQAHVVPLSR